MSEWSHPMTTNLIEVQYKTQKIEELEKQLAEKDAEIDRLREGIKAIADHQRIIGGHMATMGSVYVMATRLIEKNERG